MSTPPAEVLQDFLIYLKKNGTNILPGEGARILALTHNVVVYLQSINSRETMTNVTTVIFSLLDHILSVPGSISKSLGVRLVLDLLSSHFYNIAIGLLTSNITEYYRIAKNTIDITLVNLWAIGLHENYFHIPAIPLTDSKSKIWSTVQFSGTKNKHQMLLASRLVNGVIFRNLSRFLPPRSFLRQKDGSELEYELYSQIISIMTLPKDLDIYPVAIDFKHELHSNMNWSDDETWTVRCGYADAATFAYTWDIYSCHTDMISEEKTRCICPKSGVFALLLTLVPRQPASEENDPRKFILIVGCSLCIVLTLSTTICLTVSFWLARQSCVMALKLQCSVSVFVTGLLFLLAITTGPSQNHFMLFLTSLEAFFLLGMSSHLSKVLIVFTEIIQTPRPVVSKYTVIGIISGVPVITVFGSHLVYKTMEIKLNSWWMVTGSLAFKIFVTVISIMTILFIFLYIVVMTKLNELLFVHDKLQKPIEKRVALLKRSGFIFSAIALFSVSSIIYINYPNELWSIYQFSVYNVFLGFMLLLCYVLNSETQIKYMFKSKAKKNPEDKFFSFDSSSTPINFLTKEDAEVDNKCSPDIKDTQQFTLRTVEMPKPILKKPKPTPETHEGCFHTSTSFCSTQLDGVGESPQTPLECYSNSPQSFRKFPNPQSPDILANKACTGLDLVASSLHVVTTEPTQRPIYPPKVIITPDDAIAKILESEAVIVQDTNLQRSSGHERTQPDGRDEVIISEATAKALNGSCKSERGHLSKEVTVEIVPPPPDMQKPSTSTSKDSLNGVLDSINQDLAYLLSDDDKEPVVALRGVSKTVLQEIPEELSEEINSDLPESITLRTSC
nr:unnamed protein product [Callosobruchus analis]